MARMVKSPADRKHVRRNVREPWRCVHCGHESHLLMILRPERCPMCGAAVPVVVAEPQAER